MIRIRRSRFTAEETGSAHQKGSTSDPSGRGGVFPQVGVYLASMMLPKSGDHWRGEGAVQNLSNAGPCVADITVHDGFLGLDGRWEEAGKGGDGRTQGVAVHSLQGTVPIRQLARGSLHILKRKRHPPGMHPVEPLALLQASTTKRHSDAATPSLQLPYTSPVATSRKIPQLEDGGQGTVSLKWGARWGGVGCVWVGGWEVPYGFLEGVGWGVGFGDYCFLGAEAFTTSGATSLRRALAFAWSLALADPQWVQLTTASGDEDVLTTTPSRSARLRKRLADQSPSPPPAATTPAHESPPILNPIDKSTIKLNIHNLLGRGPLGSVVTGTLNGVFSAIKIVDVYKVEDSISRVHAELAAYAALSDLQGRAVAELVGGGMYDIFGIVATVPVVPGHVSGARHFTDLDVTDRESARHSLACLDAAGWVHGGEEGASD
ncbi:hypothetical protein BDK51DRAFT_36475 [Blyttiomyces helicus]|uniref:Protein kinase domain-containing protein n=1 Tax=Blyttiomyces helicus TaxID=388810 RepID=A0A4V1IPX5_9FUNG|nr:hypothetical protein BDK51DRAFT_36475 [Blyttiomyces helicus]|eukprot:RKO84577.1 hypothetical protein BDK51DRAFT_36475 [Blyttiomyces helicus]